MRRIFFTNTLKYAGTSWDFHSDFEIIERDNLIQKHEVISQNMIIPSCFRYFCWDDIDLRYRLKYLIDIYWYNSIMDL